MPLTCEKVIDPADGEVYVFFDYGDTIGVVRESDLKSDYAYSLEYWVDHAGSGSGCNNFVIDAFGRELDLEFTSSRGLTRAERKEALAVLS